MKTRAALLDQAVADMPPDDQRRLAQALSAFLGSVESSGLGDQLLAHHAAIPAWLK